jgi:RNA polymerase sigma-70 factor (ECF subfamily)
MNQTAQSNPLSVQPFLIKTETVSHEESDYELAQRVASGGRAALGELYERHSHRVYTLCLRMTCNPAEAEDLTQEVFILLLSKVGSFRGESQFTTWLHRLTVNEVLMHFRRRSRRREQITEDFEVPLQVGQQIKISVGAQFVNRIALETAIAQLSPSRRAVVLLHDIEGYDHEEVARQLGCKAGTSKSQLHKARLRLRLLLKSGSSKGSSSLPFS